MREMDMATKMITDSDKFVEYKYQITEFYIIIDGKKTELPTERISDFKIEHYFESASFPIFKITTVMEASLYYKIIKNKDNVKFKLRMQSYYVSRGETKKSLLTDVINDTFSFFPDDDNEDLTKDQKKEAGTYNDENELSALRNVIELFLFKASIVTGLRSTINTVLKNINLTTAITYLLSKAGVTKMLMSPFDNGKTYDVLVLPPQSIENQLKYLNNNFGFHKTGTIIYFGLFHSYILSYEKGCTAWSKNEWKQTIFYILDKTNNLSLLSGAILKTGEKKNYYNVTTEGITVDSSSVSKNVITGTDATAIDMQNSSTSKSSANAKTVGKTNSTILFNNTSNKYMADTYAAQQSANSTVVSIVVDNGKLESFNPNKDFSFIFENTEYSKKYKGKYNISTAIHTFSKNGDAFNLSSALVFKKIS
jgi:hypothetical protein